jgi:diguanylate cyclase (GGDEF)-like protein
MPTGETIVVSRSRRCLLFVNSQFQSGYRYLVQSVHRLMHFLGVNLARTERTKIWWCVNNRFIALFIVASLAAGAILFPLVTIPQRLAKEARWDALRSRVAEIGQLAASVVDGDLHRQLLDSTNYSHDLYARALKPLTRFHSANPNISYLYPMVERDRVPYFVLDSATSPDLRTSRKLRASSYMERFDIRAEYKDDWLQQIAAGKTYVNQGFQQDDYGNFLSAHVPIYDSKGRYSGFVGVDFDMQYYLGQEERFLAIGRGTEVAALILSAAIGLIAALYADAMRRRIDDLYEYSLRDELTGLLNRRGAMTIINGSPALRSAQFASILLNIDDLKRINDLHGPSSGDAVISWTANIIRDSIREGDECARVGGDEFLILAPACDEHAATEIAQRILHTQSQNWLKKVGVRFTLSIGVAVHRNGHGDFAQVYYDAAEALIESRTERRERLLINRFRSAASS